jgi:hypothetical protein
MGAALGQDAPPRVAEGHDCPTGDEILERGGAAALQISLESLAKELELPSSR